MKNLLHQMTIDLELKGYSSRTKQSYIHYIKKFSDHFGKSPVDLGTKEIRSYLHYLATEKQVSASYLKSAYSALKFLYERTLRQDWDSISLPRSKMPKRLPVILSTTEVQKILESTANLKYKAILMTVYGAGLRVSEVVNLRIKDIDSQNMQIRVQQGKGKKDRYTLLSKANLEVLRDYWRAYRPKVWLFPGRDPEKLFSVRSVERIFESTCQSAGIQKRVSIHTLRHCFATHLLESGVCVYHIQQLLGHSNLKTTIIYIHLTRRDVLNVTSPLDLICGVPND